MKPDLFSKDDLCGKIILPCCPSYPVDRQIFNRSIQKYPAAIVYCESEGDAARAVRFAATHGLTVRMRSGGHNYEGYCVGNGVLVVDTSRLKSKEIREDAGTVEIGSGITNDELYAFLGEYGYPFPSGTCPTVGAVGLTLGGGWGHSARLFGLTCDSLLEAAVIDARGNRVIAGRDRNSDLFWALRGGGGGNFGVVTSLKYRLPPKLFAVTYVDIRYAQINEKTACRFFETWQQWLDEDERRFTPNSRIFHSAKDGMGIYLRGFFYGTKQEAQASVRPFLEIDGATASFQEVSFLEATQIDASFYPKSEQFRFAGRFAQDNLTRCQIRTILSLIAERAKGAAFASVALYAMGGNIREIAPRDTAFFYRRANYIIGIETVWEEPDFEAENLAWLYPRFKYLSSITTGSYINFPYLRTGNYLRAYYGANAMRLVSVKDDYDPCSLFCFPQSI